MTEQKIIGHKLTKTSIRKHLTLKITKKIIDGYNYMKILPITNAEYVAHNDLEITKGLSDAISLIIPEGVKEVKIEAIDSNTFNIWYETYTMIKGN